MQLDVIYNNNIRQFWITMHLRSYYLNNKYTLILLYDPSTGLQISLTKTLRARQDRKMWLYMSSDLNSDRKNVCLFFLFVFIFLFLLLGTNVQGFYSIRFRYA